MNTGRPWKRQREESGNDTTAMMRRRILVGLNYITLLMQGYIELGTGLIPSLQEGMYMRLAFSLAVHVDADMIIIDEVLAVGDGVFMKKCIDRMWDLKRNGTTLLYCLQ